MTTLKIPPVVLISGGHHFLRWRRLREIIFRYEDAGWDIEELANSDELHNYLCGFAAMFEGSRVALLNSTADFDVDMIKEFGKNPDPQLGFIFCYEGTPKAKSSFGQLAKAFPKTHAKYPAPSPFEVDEVATNFCVSEVKAKGFSISPDLAAAWINRVGSDLGVVSFEVQKAVELAEAQGTKELTAGILKGSMAVISEASFWPLIDALAARNSKTVAALLGRLAETRAKQVMPILGQIRSTILQCAQAAELAGRGVSPKEAAAIVKAHPFRYQKTVLPFAKHWGKRRMFKLLQKFAATERAVLSGAIDPWNVFVSGILSCV